MLSACDDANTPSNIPTDPSSDQTLGDMDTNSELDQSSMVDAMTDGMINEEQTCVYHDDCEALEQCLNGVCSSTSKTCQFSQSCDLGEVCYEGRCVEPCLSDLSCPDEGHCINGSCLPFPTELRPSRAVEMLGSAEQIYVGVGTADLTYPIGVSAAGYGGRPGPRTPYNKSLGGSDSVIERQDVRVIVLDNGETLSILTRMPLSWSTDYLRTLIAQEVGRLSATDEQDQGVDILDHLIIFATHSHSQPGRFWNLVSALPFGTFGFGSFSKSITEGYAKAAALAIMEALNSRERGRVGWSMLDESDPRRIIHSNRRGLANDIFDDRLLALRIDDMEGQAKAALIGFGIHGTHLMTPLLTGDSAAGIEQVLSEELSAKYGRFIPVLFANGNAGNISPRGDFLSNQKLGHLQTIGALLWQVYEPLFDSMTTVSDPSLNLQIQRVELGYEQIGYNQSEETFEGRDGIYHYGAFQCVQNEKAPEENAYTLAEANCLMDLQRIVHEPVVQFQKTVVTVMQLGELFITTLPGEPASSLGLNLAQAIEQSAQDNGYAQARSFNFGYAQDHQFYLLSPDDWFRGGYEASMSTWGPYIGRYLSESVYNVAQAMIQGEQIEQPNLKPTWWPALEDDTRLAPEEASSVASIVQQPSPQLYRGQVVNMIWQGGDPAVDLPKLSLKHADDQSQVLHPRSGLAFDDSGFESVIKYLGDYATDQRWSSQWDLPYQLPTGLYYIQIDGHIGPNAEPYSLQSEHFELNGEQGLLIHHSEINDRVLSVKLSYQHTPSNDDGESPFSELQPQGTLLHIRFANLDLSELNTQHKDFRFIMGPPLSQELNVQIWNGESPTETGREADQRITVLPQPASCDMQITTGRSEQGEETQTILTEAPCTEYQIDLSSAALMEANHVLMSDQFGNMSDLIDIRNLSNP